MNKSIKNQEQILRKMGIDALNSMQEKAYTAISNNTEVLILSPTGSGKTLAFLLPLLERLDSRNKETQVLILVPTRELAIQIEQVFRDMGTGYKINAVYGGRSGSKEKIELMHTPTILVGTPGRVADHTRRGRITINSIKNLVIDEFDKSLEIGFEKEMKEIVSALNSLERKILTSATYKEKVPEFMKFNRPFTLDFLVEDPKSLDLYWVNAPKNTLITLVHILGQFGNKSGIIFCNFKDTLYGVSAYLNEKDIEHVNFYGGMEQIDRERSLIQFRNYSQRILLATDLASRGIDIPGIDYIIHYEMPMRQEEFTHRNGRTARMNADGVSICIKGKNDRIPEYAKDIKTKKINDGNGIPKSEWKTLLISGGRRDKISKGDIAGLFMKKGNLSSKEIGLIEIKSDCAFVAVCNSKADEICQMLSNHRLKKKKIRIQKI